MSKKTKTLAIDREGFDINEWLDKADYKRIHADIDKFSNGLQNGRDPLYSLVSEIFNAHSEGMSTRATRQELTIRLMHLFHRANRLQETRRDWPEIIQVWESILQDILYQFDAFETLLVGLKQQEQVEGFGYEVLEKTLKQVREMLEQACVKIDSDVRPAIPSY